MEESKKSTKKKSVEKEKTNEKKRHEESKKSGRNKSVEKEKNIQKEKKSKPTQVDEVDDVFEVLETDTEFHNDFFEEVVPKKPRKEEKEKGLQKSRKKAFPPKMQKKILQGKIVEKLNWILLFYFFLWAL